MSDRDVNNILFLLGAHPDVLSDWYTTTSDDDREYALRILQTASTHLTLWELDRIDNMLDMNESVGVPIRKLIKK
jgi:hypothetical protein